MSDYLTLAEAQAMPRFSGVADDELSLALAAANGWVADRTRPIDEQSGTIPGPLVEAAVLMTARFLARSRSVEGLVGMSGTDTVAYLPSQDRDAEALIRPYRPVVFG